MKWYPKKNMIHGELTWKKHQISSPRSASPWFSSFPGFWFQLPPTLCSPSLPIFSSFLFLSFLPCFHLPPQATPTLCPLSCPIWPPHPLNSWGGQKIIYKTNKNSFLLSPGGSTKPFFGTFFFFNRLFSLLHFSRWFMKLPIFNPKCESSRVF